MPKKVCPNGHIYNSDIYGDECPICHQVASEPSTGIQSDPAMPPFNPAAEGHTHIVAPQQQTAPKPFMVGGNVADPIGETKVRKESSAGGKTVIRPAGGQPMTKGRKLVGFLVTYNRNPMGVSYNIYEGKNFIGRDSRCDIHIQEDTQMSGQHMSILYRNVDNKFKFRDEQSSNGTFINKELLDEGELHNYDIIRLGGTVFIFIAIPKLG